MKTFYFLFAALFFLNGADVALAQSADQVLPLFSEEGCKTFWCSVLQNFPELNVWLLAIFTFIGLTLRATSDLLVFVGAKIENKSASELGAKLNSYALWAAQIIGWFGGGTSKAILAKKVADELGKQKGSGGEQPASGGEPK
jgi:hypothetical protein